MAIINTEKQITMLIKKIKLCSIEKCFKTQKWMYNQAVD